MLGLLEQFVASPLSFITTCLILLLLYVVFQCLYRLYFSPIASFPGPRLAALTGWYEFYYDVNLSGRYQFKIKELHSQYGPIIRITPWELHIDDPDYYDELYVGLAVRKTDKYRKNVAGFGDSNWSAFDSLASNLHRSRRGALNNFFSKKSVNDLAPTIQTKVDRLCQRLEEFKGTSTPVNLAHAFSAFTVDVVMDYAFSQTMENLESPDFDPTWYNAMRTVNEMYNLGCQFPFLSWLSFNLPEWFVQIADPKMTIFPRLVRICGDNIDAVRKGDNKHYESIGHKTIFHSVIQESDLPPEEQTTIRLSGEGVSLVTAGSITTAEFLTRTTYEILSNPSILSRLRHELTTATTSPNHPLTISDLENLPFLHAIVNEGHRVTYGIPHRLMRVSPHVALRYKDWTIPAGTPVGMSALLMHDNAQIFPEPGVFRPERWLEGDESKENGNGKYKPSKLEKYLVPFSKGSRQCLGMNLAHAEIYLCLGKMFGPGGIGGRLKVWETERERDVTIVRDWFVPIQGRESRGVRVVVE